MSKHSKKYLEKRDQQDADEQKLRAELEEETVRLEHSLKGVAVAAGITGMVALLGYLAYRSVSSGHKEKPQEKKSSKSEGSGFISSSFLAPVFMMAGKNLIKYLVSRIESRKEKPNSKKS